MKNAYILTSVILTAFALSGCGEKKSDHGHQDHIKIAEPIEVTVATASKKEVALYSETTGTVRSKNKASIAPKVSGQITEITVVPGQAVKKGELLVKVSALEITSKLQSAQANENRVNRDLKREQELLKSDASTPEMVENLKDQLLMAQAAVREAETMLSYTKITAPFSGIITRKHANEGDLTLPGKPLLEIENLNNLQVEADIPEALGINMEVGMELKIETLGAKEQITGKLEEIAPAADALSRTFPVKIALPSSVRLKSGQYAKVLVPSQTIETVLVPQKAVQYWGQIEQVFVIENNRLHMKIVKTGVTYGEQIEILSGLSGYESLAIRKNAPLKDGVQIN